MYPGRPNMTQEQYFSQKVPGRSLKIIEQPLRNYQEMITAVKKQEEMPIYTQQTPRPVKKIMLFDQDNNKRLFPLARDREVGINTKYQNIVIQSVRI